MMKAKKKFGQNFLQDQSVIERIVNNFRPKTDDIIYEIGPGHAALTEHLVQYNNHLNLVEIDNDLVTLLKAKFANNEAVTLHHIDALTLKFDKDEIRIIGNLPYNISTPLLINFLFQADKIKDMLFMLQKEVVKRICAEVGTKAYGRLSVMLQHSFECEELFIVKPEAFIPKPKVDSQIVRLTRRPKPLDVDLSKLEALVKLAFGQRRKTLKNNLKSLVIEDELIELNINPQTRPEAITVEQFVAITNYLSNRDL